MEVMSLILSENRGRIELRGIESEGSRVRERGEERDIYF
jgi:hypothetical protein